MDAGVLQLHVFPHEATERGSVLKDIPPIAPSLTADGPVQQTKAVTLVIPTYFNAGLKNQTLRNVIDGVDRANAITEIIFIVPPNSSDGLVDGIPDRMKVSRIECGINQRSAARNRGIAAASNELVLFIDDDMLIDDWRTIDVLVSKMLEGGYDCALFPRRQYARYPLLFDLPELAATIQQWRKGDQTFSESIVLDPLSHGCQFQTMAFCFPGCFMLISRTKFGEIGGFSEEFEGWGFEDTDFAMRAITHLNVFNLFRQTNALLHMDHPVSPYKSEEYQRNHSLFTRYYTQRDIDEFCQQVTGGDDFKIDDPRENRDDFAPLRALENIDQLTFSQDSCAEVFDHYEYIIEQRLEKGFTSHPKYVLLHGSRGEGTARDDSDYDLLVLFEGLALREFYVSHTPTGQLELEYADTGKFKQIAMQPAYYPLFGPLELAKLTRGRLLYGNEESWRTWQHETIDVAVEYGRIYWLLYALGMKLNAAKFGNLEESFRTALRSILTMADADRFRDDVFHLDNLEINTLGKHMRIQLDRDLRCWYDDMATNRRVFAYQVPEVWTALKWVESNT